MEMNDLIRASQRAAPVADPLAKKNFARSKNEPKVVVDNTAKPKRSRRSNLEAQLEKEQNTASTRRADNRSEAEAEPRAKPAGDGSGGESHNPYREINPNDPSLGKLSSGARAMMKADTSAVFDAGFSAKRLSYADAIARIDQWETNLPPSAEQLRREVVRFV